MAQNVPRRLMRFYRGGEAPALPEQNTNNDYNQKVSEESDPFSPNGRPLLGEIPSMEYEDIEKNKKNYEEIKHIEQKNMEEKIALEEVEKFKKTHNRIPTKEESEKIADNLYNQFKNVDTNALYANMGNNSSASTAMNAPPMDYGAEGGGRRSRREQRMDAKKQTRSQASRVAPRQDQRIPQNAAPPINSEITDVKSLLEDEFVGKGKKSKAEDEFDLGLDGNLSSSEDTSGETSGEEDIENINLNEKETCPNCKKETDKIIYCPKCGTAFCASCAKKEGGSILCPKCGTKIKS